MTTLGGLGWRSIWVPPKGGKAATVPCMIEELTPEVAPDSISSPGYLMR